MALDTTIDFGGTVDGRSQVTYPVGIVCEWEQIIDRLSVADNSGNSILNPTGSITAATKRKIRVNGRGTTMLMMVKYDDGHTTMVTSPIIQAFGIDRNGVVHKLKNAAGTHEITMTCAPTTDITDGTDLYSDTVEIDLDGSVEVLVGVKTVFNADGDDTLSRLLVKLK